MLGDQLWGARIAPLECVEQSRVVADRIKTIDAALNAAKACPALYQACQDARAKACSESLAPVG